MKLSTRLTTLAITAVAVAGVLGAQGRNEGRSSAPRGQAPRAQAPQHAQAPQQHAQAPRAAPMQNRGRQDARPQQYAGSRTDVRGGNRYEPRNDPRSRAVADRGNEFRGREGYRPPVAQHGRPLITRGGYRGVSYGGGYRYWRGVDRFGVRIALPFGWYQPLYVRGYFPVNYYNYCEPVPYDLEYMLPEMYDGQTSCLVGDRVVVYDRASRGISFVAVIP